MEWDFENLENGFMKEAGIWSSGKKFLKRQFSAGFKSLPKQHRRGLMRQGMGSGVDSLLAIPTKKVSDLIAGKSRTRKKIWKAIQQPAISADISVGKFLNRVTKTVTPFNNLFKIKEKVPLGGKVYKELTRHSAMAPATKLTAVATPFLVASGMERGLSTVLGKKQEKRAMDKMAYVNKEAMIKLAEEMLKLKEENDRLSRVNKGHEKRAKATSLIFKKAELGMDQIPGTYEELLEKVASVENEDLAIMEKAIELSGGDLSLGQLGSQDYSSTESSTPEGQFALTIMGDHY